MDAMYQVALIPQDLRHEENIIQIADVLDHLNNVVDDIFAKILCRVDENAKRIKSIQHRVEICDNKLHKLIGTNKATKVMCSAKYPATECHKNVESIFKDNKMMDIVRTHKDIKTKPVVYSEKEIKDKLEFYHVKVGSVDPVQAILEKSLPKHHGSPPENIRAVGCLMIYGSEDIVYGSGGRGGIGPVGGSTIQVAKEAIERIPQSPLHEPPATVATRESHNRGQFLYLYSPNMEEVPTMDMPQDLPHLSGIAGDMKFQLDTEPTIAPSARVQSLTPPAPNTTSRREILSEEKLDTFSPTEELLLEKQIAEKENVEDKKIEKTPPVQTPAPSVAPPPPPPPPPPALPLEETDSKDRKQSRIVKTTEVVSITAPPDGRASLMEAIRKAGGSGKARLRSVTTAAKEDNKNKNIGVSSGDLMADLHAKLSMRRKGISGTRPGAGEGTILAAISAIIPPPPETDLQSNSEVSSTEDDWE